MSLIPLDVAKTHLRITDTAHDADVTLKTTHAEALILDYLGARVVDADGNPWTEATLPPHVQACILHMLTHLYEHRGDDMSPSASGTTPDAEVWAAIERALMRSRDPALA